MKTKKRIILRANGTTLIGFGHLYRLMALANMLQEDFYLIFAIFKTNDFIEKEIRNCCDEVIVLPGELPYKTSDEIKPTDEIIFDIGRIIQKGDIVVLDGYYFGAAYQKAAKEKGCKVVSIDDLAVNHFFFRYSDQSCSGH